MMFDGVLSVVGANPPNSSYPAYLPKVNQRNAVLSDFTIDLQFTHNTDTDYTANVEIEKVGTYTGTNIVLQVFVVESHLDINWGLGEYVNSVNRLMVPNQYGTALDFSGGNTQSIELTFDIQGYWNTEHCELIAFIQDNTSKEVLQTTMKSMSVPDFALDAELFEVMNIPETMCAGILEPEVTIKNKGADILTTCNVNFEVNGNLVYTYPWTGTLGFTETDFIEVPEFTFSADDDNEIVVYLSDPNGGTDDNPDNNSKTFNTTPPENVTDMLILIMKTDDQPQETSWKVFDATGNVVDEGGPYTQPQLFFKDTVFYQSTGCHQFVMYDAGGNGLTTYYVLRSYIDGLQETIHTGTSFGYKESTHFTVDDFTEVEVLDRQHEVIFYPNPLSHKGQISFELLEETNIEINIFNLTGQPVKTVDASILGPGNHNVQFDVEDLRTGIYLIQTKIGSETMTKRISVIR